MTFDRAAHVYLLVNLEASGLELNRKFKSFVKVFGPLRVTFLSTFLCVGSRAIVMEPG